MAVPTHRVIVSSAVDSNVYMKTAVRNMYVNNALTSD